MSSVHSAEPGTVVIRRIRDDVGLWAFGASSGPVEDTEHDVTATSKYYHSFLSCLPPRAVANVT